MHNRLSLAMKGISALRQNPIPYSRTRPKRKLTKLSFPGFLMLLLLAHIQCRKSYPPPNILPPVTQEGKNTFGCKVNGQVWIPFYQCGLIELFNHCKELQSVVTNQDTTGKLPIYFELTASREIVVGSLFSFHIDARILKTGNVDSSSFQIYYLQDSVNYFPQYPLSHASNALNLTKVDTINHIISGTFHFTLYSPYGPAGGDSVVVTDGRFDVTYNACLCH